MRPQPGEFYKHFKDKLYQIVAIANHSETDEELVIYQALYGDYKIYARPLAMFVSEVDHNKYPDVTQKYRFEKVLLGEKEERVEETKTVAFEEESVLPTELKENGEVPDKRLIDFLDAETFAQKADLLKLYSKNIDDKLIDAIAASLDTIVPEGSIDDRYNSLRSFVNTQAKYECNRFR